MLDLIQKYQKNNLYKTYVNSLQKGKKCLQNILFRKN